MVLNSNSVKSFKSSISFPGLCLQYGLQGLSTTLSSSAALDSLNTLSPSKRLRQRLDFTWSDRKQAYYVSIFHLLPLLLFGCRCCCNHPTAPPLPLPLSVYTIVFYCTTEREKVNRNENANRWEAWVMGTSEPPPLPLETPPCRT